MQFWINLRNQKHIKALYGRNPHKKRMLRKGIAAQKIFASTKQGAKARPLLNYKSSKKPIVKLASQSNTYVWQPVLSAIAWYIFNPAFTLSPLASYCLGWRRVV